MPPALFFLKITLAIWGLLWFHTNYSSFVFCNDAIGILIVWLMGFGSHLLRYQGEEDQDGGGGRREVMTNLCPVYTCSPHLLLYLEQELFDVWNNCMCF